MREKATKFRPINITLSVRDNLNDGYKNLFKAKIEPKKMKRHDV